MAGLRNVDRSDREMLIVIERVADADGIASAADIADVLGVGKNGNRSPAGRIASRLSWMARPPLEYIQRLDPKATGRPAQPSLWVITDLGTELLRGRINKTVSDTLDRGDTGTQLLIMRQLVQRSYVYGSDHMAAAIRREYLHNVAQR